MCGPAGTGAVSPLAVGCCDDFLLSGWCVGTDARPASLGRWPSCHVQEAVPPSLCLHRRDIFNLFLVRGPFLSSCIW